MKKTLLRKTLGVCLALVMVIPYLLVPCVQAADNVLLFSDDFESYTSNDLLTELEDNNWVFEKQNVDTFEIAEDLLTGSNAMKVTVANNGGAQTFLNAMLEGGSITEGTIIVDYDFRAENHSKRIPKIGVPMYDLAARYTYLDIFNCGKDLFVGAWQYVGDINASKSAYMHIQQIIDVTNKQVEFFYNGSKIGTFNAQDSKCVDFITFTFNAGEGAFWDYDGPDEGDGIYWIDNVSVKKAVFGVSGTNIASGKISSAAKGVELQFNAPIDESTITSGVIEVYENNKAVTEFDAYVSEDDAGKLVVALDNGFTPFATYRIKVKKSLGTTKTNFMAMQADYTVMFRAKNVASDDFESYEIGDGPGILLANDWLVEAVPGDIVEIAVDPVTGSQALKFVIKNETASETYARAVFPNVSEGKLKFSFDFRAENHSKNLKQIGTPSNDTYYAHSVFSIYGCTNDIYGGAWQYICNAQEAKEQYIHFDIITDAKTGVSDVYINNTKVLDQVAGNEKGSIDMAFFSFNSGVGIYDGYNGTDTGDGIYWIDNLDVTKVEEEAVEGVSVKYLNSLNQDIVSLADVAGENVKVELTIGDDVADDYKVFAAIKSDDKMLKAIRTASKPESGNVVDLTLPVDAEADANWNIECFIWDGNSFCPFRPVETLNKE